MAKFFGRNFSCRFVLWCFWMFLSSRLPAEQLRKTTLLLTERGRESKSVDHILYRASYNLQDEDTIFCSSLLFPILGSCVSVDPISQTCQIHSELIKIRLLGDARIIPDEGHLSVFHNFVFF